MLEGKSSRDDFAWDWLETSSKKNGVANAALRFTGELHGLFLGRSQALTSSIQARRSQTLTDSIPHTDTRDCFTASLSHALYRTRHARALFAVFPSSSVAALSDVQYMHAASLSLCVFHYMRITPTQHSSFITRARTQAFVDCHHAHTVSPLASTQAATHADLGRFCALEPARSFCTRTSVPAAVAHGSDSDAFL